MKKINQVKKIILSFLLLTSVFYTSCKKEDNITLQNEDALAPGSTERLSNSTQSRVLIDNPAVYRGMYVDNFNLIFGNTTSENNLISYAVRNNINALSFYGLRNMVASSSNYTKLASFMSRCSQNGITNRVYVNVYYSGSVNSNDTTYVRNYNNSRTLSSEKITGFNLEWEWWNGATTWTTYDLTMKSYFNWTRTQSPVMTSEIYFGWFQNPTNIPATMATEMIKYCDRILLHDYRVVPDVAYMKGRMDYLGQAANTQLKKEKIVILFSAESCFMGPYYATHTFDAAYQSIVTQYNAVTFTGKTGLEIQGWQLFHYSLAKLCRP